MVQIWPSCTVCFQFERLNAEQHLKVECAASKPICPTDQHVWLFPDESINHNITTPIPPLLEASTLFLASTPPAIGAVR